MLARHVIRKMNREYQYITGIKKADKAHLIFSIMMRNGLAEVETVCGRALGGRLDMLPIYKNKQKRWFWCKSCLKKARIENEK